MIYNATENFRICIMETLTTQKLNMNLSHQTHRAQPKLVGIAPRACRDVMWINRNKFQTKTCFFQKISFFYLSQAPTGKSCMVSIFIIR